MTLKTSLLITGDAAGAIAAVDGLGNAVDRTAQSARAAAGPTAALDAAQSKAAASARDEAAALRDADDAQARAAASGRILASAEGQVATASGNAARASRNHAAASNDNAAALNRHANGARNLGQQFGDLAVMVQGGISPARAFATQAGQMGYALSEMGGAAGKVGAFLVGPWGIALTVAVAALAPLVEGLLAGKKALFELETGADAVAAAQSALGGMFDLATGKLEKNTEALRLNAQAQALNLMASSAKRRADAAAAIGGAGEPTVRSSLTSLAQIGTGAATGNYDMLGEGVGTFRGNSNLRELRNRYRRAQAITDPIKRAKATQIVMQQGYGIDQRDGGSAGQALAQGILNQSLGDSEADAAARIQRSLNSGVLDSGLRRDGRDKKGKKPPSRAAIEEFGRDAVARLAGIADGFDDTPPAVKRVDAALRQIDDLVDDLRRKKPLNFEQTIRQAEQLRDVVRSGLTAPFREFVEQQQQSFAVGQALLAGDSARAEQLKAIAQLERQMGPLTELQRDAVLATVQAQDAQARQLEVMQARQQVYLSGLGQIRDITRQASQEFVRGDLGQMIKNPGRLLDAFQTAKGEQLFNELFDGAFRELQDQITGTSVVEDASQRMADAVGLVELETRATATALGTLQRAATGAAGAVGGGAGYGSAAASAAGAVVDGAIAGGFGQVGREVVVNGRPRITRDPVELFSGALGKIAGSIGDKLGIKSPEEFGKAVGKGAGRAIEGAATGAAVAGIGKSLGINLNGTGSAIGGAIGGFLPIPGGQVIGSILGGLAGGLFTKPKTGSAAISNTTDAATLSGTDKALKAQANSLAGSVQKGIAQIAEQLGGDVGSFKVSIGTYKDTFRVNTSGGATNGKNKGFTDYGEDADAAVSAAIRDAIADGGVTGISAAVAKAIRSSTDLDKSLKEALKVQDLELAIGGVATAVAKATREFETQAKDRLRIATEYGFDVVAIEKRNAEDRAKLTEQLVAAQVGSLKGLVDEITRGSLFEGSAVDRIELLNTEIAKAKADLDAGVAGAADTLSGLYQQRLGVAKDAYATTSGFADIRTDTLDQARAAIARANAQIVAAQAGQESKSDPALAATNAALDENNDQNARMIASLDRSNFLSEQLAAALGASAGSFDLGQLARY